MRRSTILLVLACLAAGAGRAGAQDAAPAPLRGAQGEPEAVPWTSVPRRVERREPTVFVPAPADINVAVPRAPAPIGAAATHGSAMVGPPDPDEVTYHRPMVVDPGAFRAGEVEVRFAGIAPLALDQHCPGADGAPWPCGRRALAALRDLVRHRPLHCLAVGRDGDILVARCRVGRTDVAAWLVERGWARPLEEDGRLQRLSAVAREARAGQFAAESGNRP